MASPLTENAKSVRTLVSWKEIAAFLNRGERTVKRWERERGLPVHRVPGGERGGVFAYPDELANWLKGKASELEADDAASGEQVATLAVSQATKGSADEFGITPAATASTLAPVRHRRTVNPARVAAWLTPLALTTILVLFFTVNHSNSGVTAVGNRELSSDGDPVLALDSVAVLPFVNVSGNANSDYISDGITESLIGNLAHIPQLKLRSRDAVFHFKGKNIEAKNAGSELDVSLIVSGRVTIEGGDIQVRTELTDVRDNTEIWGKQYAGKISGLLRLQQQIAGDIAEKLRSTLTSADVQQITQQGTENAEAYTLYLKGRYAWNLRDRANLDAAISWFNQAIVKDPGYALAYSGLADTYAVLPNYGGIPGEDFPKSNAAAHKALELDPSLAHPHAILGANEMEYDWDFAGGEAEFKKALALDPNDATAHQWYAEKISQLGRHQEALAEIHHAHELDPLSPVITRVIAGTLVDAGQYDQGIEICKRLATENPTFPMVHDCLVYGYWGKHTYSEAINEWILESRLNGTPDETKFADALENGYRSAGRKGAFAEAAAVLEARRHHGYASPFMIARFYADIGDTNKAFNWLDTAYRERDRLLTGLEVSPGFDNVRTDPRFTELARKVGLPTMQ